ncbi:NAD(P)/FAD-dependent oxidoreductase [Rhizobium sp. TRM95111]|uniref:flavin-containing monooxygenase n=1 Tax=Rhizobium alarense TaxID=2846851 RepID=UPI001F475822|nr:NAD(P)/FAD-dependent oxidoreductase [Rhizobium alarense]MCF3641616.1 NAD(P)/FAD-dependent oxidoreductase [Rhizobium alarense]
MPIEKIHTLVVGGGQAGIAMSEHLSRQGIEHLVLERHRIAEKWRTSRWDSLVANGPAWHDRFPNMTFDDIDPLSFASKDRIVRYFEEYAKQINAPIRCGVEVFSAAPKSDAYGFIVETSEGVIEAENVVAATGAFQRPIIPPVIPVDAGVTQIHSNEYRNPAQLPQGAVLVIGAGSSGSQIADEILRSGRTVYLAVGPHEKPPLRYRGKDFCWWLGVLGHWDIETPDPLTEHVTIAVSGANGQTVDFREFAERGMKLVGKAERYESGILHIAQDLAQNIADGEASYMALLDEADAYAEKHGINLPDDPDARRMRPMPDCVSNPILEIDLKAAGVRSVIWATGYALDFSWIKGGDFDHKGRPRHEKGITHIPGLYVLGLPWLTRRASPFIWGVWHDAEHLSAHIAGRQENDRVGSIIGMSEPESAY